MALGERRTKTMSPAPAVHSWAPSLQHTSAGRISVAICEPDRLAAMAASASPRRRRQPPSGAPIPKRASDRIDIGFQRGGHRRSNTHPRAESASRSVNLTGWPQWPLQRRPVEHKSDPAAVAGRGGRRACVGSGGDASRHADVVRGGLASRWCTTWAGRWMDIGKRIERGLEHKSDPAAVAGRGGRRACVGSGGDASRHADVVPSAPTLHRRRRDHPRRGEPAASRIWASMRMPIPLTNIS